MCVKGSMFVLWFAFATETIPHKVILQRVHKQADVCFKSLKECEKSRTYQRLTDDLLHRRLTDKLSAGKSWRVMCFPHAYDNEIFNRERPPDRRWNQRGRCHTGFPYGAYFAEPRHPIYVFRHTRLRLVRCFKTLRFCEDSWTVNHLRSQIESGSRQAVKCLLPGNR